MFIGLFIVVHGFQVQVVMIRWGIDGWGFLLKHPIGLLSFDIGRPSRMMVSNVPAVLLFEPVLQRYACVSRQSVLILGWPWPCPAPWLAI